MARMRNIIQQHWLLPIWVLGLACFSLPSTARAPSSIVLYEIGQTLIVHASDIKHVVAQQNKHDGSAAFAPFRVDGAYASPRQ